MADALPDGSWRDHPNKSVSVIRGIDIPSSSLPDEKGQIARRRGQCQLLIGFSNS
jgi:hypothetical protein